MGCASARHDRPWPRTGMRQEVDIRYVVTSLKGTAQHLYEDVYCQRGQMENLIKLHKAQLASDRMSCHSATANQVRLALHTAAFWLMHCVRSAIPQTNPLARCEFATLRERLIKIGARVIEHIARIRVRRSKRSSPDFLRALVALETIHRLITRLTVLPWVSIAAMARGCPSENY